MQLTTNFSLQELTASAKALAKGIDNTPSDEAIEALKALCENVLQPARDEVGSIEVSSGYRCPALNKAVKGAKNSQHVLGEAADISNDDSAALFHFIRENLEFDQLIWEEGNDEQPAWVHVSYSLNGNRNTVLRKRVNSKGYEIWEA